MLRGDPGRQTQSILNAEIKALRGGVARTLTRAAGMTQDTFIATEKQVFRSPSNFMTMTSGFRIETAKPSQADLQAAWRAKERQARVLQFSVGGGPRVPGDPGTSDKQMFTPTDYSPLTAAGGLPRGFTKKIVTEIERGKKVRKRRRRKETVAADLRRTQGFFFGSIGKREDVGFVQRPDRRVAETVIGVDGKRPLVRPRDPSRQAHNLGWPKMVAVAKKQTEYDAKIDLPAIANAALAQAIGPNGSELARRVTRNARGRGDDGGAAMVAAEPA